MQIISLLISLISIAFSICTFVLVFLREKKRDTIDAYHDIQNDLYAIYEYTDEELEDYLIDRNTEIYKVLSTCLANLEIFATGVRNGVYNYKTFYQMGHGYIDISLRAKLDMLLAAKNKYGNNKYYQNTQWLLNKMDADSC